MNTVAAILGSLDVRVAEAGKADSWCPNLNTDQEETLADMGQPAGPVPPAKSQQGLRSPDLAVEAWWLIEQLYRWDSWVHRRVETLEFVSFKTLRRHTSVDLTIPKVANDVAAAMRTRSGGLIVPLTLMGKTPGILKHFDAVDHRGRPLPIMTREHGQALTREMLRRLIVTAGLPEETVDEMAGSIGNLVENQSERSAQTSREAVMDVVDREMRSRNSLGRAAVLFVQASGQLAGRLRRRRESGYSGLDVPLNQLDEIIRTLDGVADATAEATQADVESLQAMLDRVSRSVEKVREARATFDVVNELREMTAAEQQLERGITTAYARAWFHTLSDYFVRCYPLLAVVDARPEERIVLKYDFDQYAVASRDDRSPDADRSNTGAASVWASGWYDILRLAGLVPQVVPIQVPQAQLAKTYHLEIPVADGLVIMNPRFVEPDRSPLANSHSGESNTDRAHLYVTRSHAGTNPLARIEINLTVRVLMTTTLLALSTFAVLCGALILHATGHHADASGPASLVIAIPGVFAAFVFRPGEHATLRWLIRGWRLLAILLIASSFVAAAFLAVTPRLPFFLWGIPTTVAGLISILVTGGLVRAVMQQRRGLREERV